MGHLPVYAGESNEIYQLTRKLTQATVESSGKEPKPMVIKKYKPVELVDLTKRLWEKIKSIPSIRHVTIKSEKLFHNDAKTRAVLKEVLNNMVSVEFEFNIRSQSMKNIWALGFRFTSLRLDFRFLSADDQIKVIKSINPGIYELDLALPEPNQKVIDTISSCFKTIKMLEVAYFRESKVKNPFPAISSLEAMDLNFLGYDDFIPFTPTKIFKDTRTLSFNCIEFDIGLEKWTESIAPVASYLILMDSIITKTSLELHFGNITKLKFCPRDGYWGEWGIARDLKHLTELSLELPEEYSGYSTYGFKYPQVTSLVIENIYDINILFWQWLSEGFPQTKYLSLNAGNELPDQYNEIFPFQTGLLDLIYLNSTLDLSPKTYMDFVAFSPNIKQMDIPAGIYTLLGNID